jgi:hypothetical protein
VFGDEIRKKMANKRLYSCQLQIGCHRCTPGWSYEEKASFPDPNVSEGLYRTVLTLLRAHPMPNRGEVRHGLSSSVAPRRANPPHTGAQTKALIVSHRRNSHSRHEPLPRTGAGSSADSHVVPLLNLFTFQIFSPNGRSIGRIDLS